MSDAGMEARTVEIKEHPHGAFSWAELVTSDQQAATKFYAELFGWAHHDSPIGDGVYYTMFHLHEKTVAAACTMQPDQQQAGISPHWRSYITVDDVNETTAQVEAIGGKVLAQPFDVMDQGRMSTIQDPTGATVSLWEARNHIGTSFYQVPGAMCWNELYTHDVPAASNFYKTLLGWTVDVGTLDNGAPYAGLNNREQPVAVMMPITEEVGNMPPNWMVYFGVKDIQERAAKVQELGGTLLFGPAEHSGFWFALIQDPQGALFYMIAS